MRFAITRTRPIYIGLFTLLAAAVLMAGLPAMAAAAQNLTFKVYPDVAGKGGIKPIANATVALKCTNCSGKSGKTTLTGTTDDAGKVIFTDILARTWKYDVSAASYASKSGTVTIGGGQSPTITVKLPKATGGR